MRTARSPPVVITVWPGLQAVRLISIRLPRNGDSPHYLSNRVLVVKDRSVTIKVLSNPQLGGELLNRAAERGLCLAAISDYLASMQHRRVIAASEVPSYRRERERRATPTKEHGHLPSLGDFPLPAPPAECEHIEVKGVRDRLNDILRAPQAARPRLRKVRQERWQVKLVWQSASRQRVSLNPVERSLKIAHITLDMASDVVNNGCRQNEPERLRLLAQYRKPGLQARGLHISAETPPKTREQAVLNTGQLSRRVVGAEYELPAPLVDGFKHGGKRLLGSSPPRQKLNVIDKQEVK